MITKEFADHFVAEWLDAWNSHDVEHVLSHYTDDFEMSSAFIIQVAGEPSGKLKGKAAVGAYWRAALERMPTLHFEHFTTFVGIDSIIIHYKGARGMAAELFFFNDDLQVWKCCAHYE